MKENRSNLSKGQESYDSDLGGNLVEFFNRNISQYPTEIGAPSFQPIPVEKQKDIMVNVARLHAEQEYNRIMELVAVLQKQADSIKRRLEITDAIHSAKYNFQIYHGQCYWLAHSQRSNGTILTPIGPDEWSTGAPDDYQYICKVKWLGDHTWVEVDEKGNPLWVS